MNKIALLLLIAAPLCAPTNTQGFTSDASHGVLLDTCEGLDSSGGPRFLVCVRRASIDTTSSDPGNESSGHYYLEDITAPWGSLVVANWSEYTSVDGTSTNPTNDPYSTELANNLSYYCGSYGGTQDTGGTYGSELAVTMAGLLNDWMAGEPMPTNVVVTESHNGQSFDVTYDEQDEYSTLHCEVSVDLDGAVVPTSNLNQGRDHPKCDPDKGCGAPVWQITEPYLNLWVHDTPVFYRSSLGREIPFTVN